MVDCTVAKPLILIVKAHLQGPEHVEEEGAVAHDADEHPNGSAGRQALQTPAVTGNQDSAAQDTAG